GEEAEQLAEPGFVIDAAHAGRGAVERDGARDLEHERRTDTSHAPVEVPARDAPHLPEGNGTGEQRREHGQQLARGFRYGEIRLAREVAAGRLEHGPCVGTP